MPRGRHSGSCCRQVSRVKGRRFSEDGLLSGSEIAELLLGQMTELPGEVAVGLEAGVIPRSLGIGA